MHRNTKLNKIFAVRSTVRNLPLAVGW